MNFVKCEYCQKDLSDPDNLVVGTHIFSKPKMYHVSCYDDFKANGSYFKKPRSMWAPEKLYKALELSKYRALIWAIFLFLTPFIIYSILNGKGDLDEIQQIAFSIMLMILLIVSIRNTFMCWKKYKGYVEIYEYHRNMINNETTL